MDTEEVKHKKKAVSSRFFQRPGTRTGWWAAGLAITAIGLIVLNQPVVIDLLWERMSWLSSIMLPLYGFMLIICLAAVIVGLIAVIRRRERSWLVWLFILPAINLLMSLVSMVIMLYLRILGGIQDQQLNPGPLEVAPTSNVNIERIPVIFDDDGSPDGTTALLYLLSDPAVDLKAVSISYGEAHPEVYIQYIGGMLDAYGYSYIPLGAGQDAPLSGTNSFPVWVQDASDGFWGFPVLNADRNYQVQDSAELFVATINRSPEPITIFVSGSLTSLAQALRIDPGIRENIAAVYIMGGAVYVPGNQADFYEDPENTVAEWNVFVDPLAASEVFESGLDLYLVPLDATNQVTITRQDTGQWRTDGRIPNFAADIYESLMNSWGAEEVAIWDLMTAEIMMNPDSCGFQALHLEVDTNEGNTLGQTAVVPGGDPNVNVCLEPDADLIRATLIQVFSNRH